jgi:glycosyltransferase involved in cell wall biosynthesis
MSLWDYLLNRFDASATPVSAPSTYYGLNPIFSRRRDKTDPSFDISDRYHRLMNYPAVSVVQLSTGHVGGAGLAARRLHEQLLAEGIRSEFYCIQRENFTPNLYEYSINRSVWRKILSKIMILINQRLTSGAHFSVFSTNARSLGFFKTLSREKQSVLHFNNWQNLISQKNLLKLIKAGFPVVLTIHDERVTTGGCHYRLNCYENIKGCQKCPRAHKILHHKISKNRLLFSKINLAEYPNFRIISPSTWLRICSTASLAIGSQQIVNILNPLGPNWNPKQFNYSPKGKCLEKVKIGVATMSDSFVKFGDLLDELKSNSEFQTHYELLYLRDFNDGEGGLSVFWQEIDFLLALSRADNSPNSVLEARSLQIPVLTSKVGGIPELLGRYDMALENEDHTVEVLLRKLAQMTTNIRNNQVSEEINRNTTVSGFVKVYSLALENSKQALEWRE